MEIKILENNNIIIDRKDIQRKFLIVKKYISGTFIENYFVYESYNYYDNLSFINNNEDEYMQFYNEFTNFEDLLKSIQEEN